jgi:hypothetical protein
MIAFACIAGIWAVAIVAFLWFWHRLISAPEPAPDPLDALKAERARPLRERRPYSRIDAEMRAIINQRLAGGR